MCVLGVAVVAIGGLLLATLAAIYSHGPFVDRTVGEPSAALGVSAQGTALDEIVAALLAVNPGASGLMLLADNLDAFAVRAISARQAGRSLDLQYYIWSGDLTGRLLIRELLKAADRGVRVRMLLDDINSHAHDRAYLALTIHPNIDVRLFNPSRSRTGAIVRGFEMLLSAARVNRRMHNKSWIADGRIAVVGGRNIGDAYFDAANASNFCDLDLLLLGPTVVQAEVIFDRFWNSRSAIPIGSLSQRQQNCDLQALRRDLDTLAISEQAEPYLRRVAESISVQRMLSGQVHWSKNAQVISDPPEKANATGHDGWLINTISPILTSATTDIEIISPYFVPGRNGADELAAIAAKGVRVVVLTNSLAATDVAAVHGAYARYRRPLLKSGVELFELKPYDRKSRISLMGSSSASLHTKAFTVDGRTGFIGSMNFDPRSISLNTEMGVLFTHPDVIRGVRQTFAEESASRKSYRVFLKNNKLMWQDSAANPTMILDREPKASFGRRIISMLVGLLPIESLL